MNTAPRNFLAERIEILTAAIANYRRMDKDFEGTVLGGVWDEQIASLENTITRIRSGADTWIPRRYHDVQGHEHALRCARG